MGDLIKGPWSKKSDQQEEPQTRSEIELRASTEDTARLIKGDATANDVIDKYADDPSCAPNILTSDLDKVSQMGKYDLLSALEHYLTHPEEFKPSWIFAVALVYRRERRKPEDLDIVPPPDA